MHDNHATTMLRRKRKFWRCEICKSRLSGSFDADFERKDKLISCNKSSVNNYWTIDVDTIWVQVANAIKQIHVNCNILGLANAKQRTLSFETCEFKRLFSLNTEWGKKLLCMLHFHEQREIATQVSKVLASLNFECDTFQSFSMDFATNKKNVLKRPLLPVISQISKIKRYFLWSRDPCIALTSFCWFSPTNHTLRLQNWGDPYKPNQGSNPENVH